MRNNRATPVTTTLNTSTIASIEGGRDITRLKAWLADLLPPQDRILVEEGGGNLEIFERVSEDDQVQASLSQRFTALLSRQFEVRPGDGQQSSIKAADFIRDTLTNLDWDDITEKMAWGIFYGYSVAECLYARDGRYVILDPDRGGLRVRHRRRFGFDRQLKPRLITWDNFLNGEELPDRKFWLFRIGADNDDEPWGRGLASWLYWPVFFKRGGLKKWLLFLEKFAQPTVTGKYRQGTSEKAKAELLEILQAIAEDTCVTIPDGMVIELLEAGRTGAADYDNLLSRMDGSIAKLVLNETMTLEDGSSLSQSQTHLKVRDALVERDSKIINESFNRQVVRWLIDSNYANFQGAAYPIVWRRLDEEANLDGLANRDTSLYSMGFRPTLARVTKQYGEGYTDTQAPTDEGASRTAEPPQPLYARMGVGVTQSLMAFLQQTKLPRARVIKILTTIYSMTEDEAAGLAPDDDDDGGRDSDRDDDGGRDSDRDDDGGRDSDRDDGDPPQADQDEPEQTGALSAAPTTIDTMVERLQREAAPLVGEWTALLGAMVDDSRDLQDLMGKLEKAYPQLSTDKMQEKFASAFLSARLAGQYEVQEE